MRSIIIILFVVSTSAAFSQSKTEKLAIARIQYVYRLKRALGDKAWPSFGNDEYNIPIIYYSGDTTFIANPKTKFLKQFNPTPVLKKKNLKIYRLSRRIDTTRLRMLVSISYGPDTSLFDYNTPYMKCNSREEFVQVTPFKPDTRGWVAIIMHEFFHGFQFLHIRYRQYVAQNNLIYSSVREPLQNLYNTQDWYMQRVSSENDFLIKAYESGNEKETDSHIRSFFLTRRERRSRISTDPNFNFEVIEKTFETMEGCARLIESFFLSIYLKDRNLKSIDPEFTVGRESRISIDNLKKVTEGDYYYATGYNIARLLKKLNIDFTSSLYKQESATLEDILWEYHLRKVDKKK